MTAELHGAAFHAQSLGWAERYSEARYQLTTLLHGRPTPWLTNDPGFRPRYLRRNRLVERPMDDGLCRCDRGAAVGDRERPAWPARLRSEHVGAHRSSTW